MNPIFIVFCLIVSFILLSIIADLYYVNKLKRLLERMIDEEYLKKLIKEAL